MSLRVKVVQLVVSVFLVYVFVDYTIQRFVVFPRFVALERDKALDDIERCREALQREISHLSLFTHDWAAWDDTCKFIADANQEYERQNLTDTVFQDAKLNLLYYVRLDGEVVWGQVRDLDHAAIIQVEEFPADRFPPDHQLLRHTGPDSRRDGIVMTQRGPMLISSQPIITSDNQGPVRGTLMMGRLLSDEAIESLAEQTRVDVEIWPVGQTDLADEDRRAAARITDNLPTLIEERSGKMLAVYTTFSDIAGQPALLMRADVPRDISVKGRAATQFATLSLITAGLCTLVVLIFLLQRMVIGPVVRLTAHATAIGASGDLTARIAMPRHDEIGTLAVEFDRMVQRLAESRNQLAEASRLAGMSEVASGVLHNVGNVLTSVNASAATAADKVRKLAVSDLVTVTDLMNQRADDLGTFVTSDEKGKLIPRFLAELGQHLTEQQQTVLHELQSLNKDLEHIKGIIEMQQKYAKVSGVAETVSLADLMEDALRINGEGLNRHKVRVVRAYRDVPAVTTDRHKVLQILVNLISNAKYALDECDTNDRVLTLSIGPHPERKDCVQMEVTDTGRGIRREDLTRIFSYGFTTKKDGNGFGLHSGALAAKSLGGSLTARSDGPGRGATFAVVLPMKPTEVQA